MAVLILQREGRQRLKFFEGSVAQCRAKIAQALAPHATAVKKCGFDKWEVNLSAIADIPEGGKFFVSIEEESKDEQQ